MRAVLKLATPMTFVMLVATTTNVLYTYYVSRLGADAIAAVSLVFPITLLVTTTMNGGLGAGATSGIARALGAGQPARAAAIAEHALAIAAARAGCPAPSARATPDVAPAPSPPFIVVVTRSVIGKTSDTAAMASAPRRLT